MIGSQTVFTDYFRKNPHNGNNISKSKCFAFNSVLLELSLNKMPLLLYVSYFFFLLNKNRNPSKQTFLQINSTGKRLKCPILQMVILCLFNLLCVIELFEVFHIHTCMWVLGNTDRAIINNMSAS